jgi:hypothetical protein
MNITSAKYYKNPYNNDDENVGIKLVVNDQEMHVPLDPDNRHYAAILEWAKEDGNEIAAAD